MSLALGSPVAYWQFKNGTIAELWLDAPSQLPSDVGRVASAWDRSLGATVWYQL